MEGSNTLPYHWRDSMKRIIKRTQAKLAGLGKTVSKKVVAGGAAVTVFAGNAMAAGYVAPTPEYTDFNSVVGVGLGVTLIVGLAYKAKGFLS